jgi:hypothetical protein
MTEITNRADDADEDRRKFLATCGKFAVVTPPAITMLLSTSLHSPAIAQSGGGGARFHRSNGVPSNRFIPSGKGGPPQWAAFFMASLRPWSHARFWTRCRAEGDNID